MLIKHLNKFVRTPRIYLDRTKYFRLDKNERIVPFSKKTINGIKKLISSDVIQSYSSNEKKLIYQVSKLEKINKDCINIIPGADSGLKYIFEIFSFLKKKSAACIFPTYGMFEVYSKIYRYKIYKINENDDIVKYVKKILKNKLSFLYLANPNQPSGKYIDKKKILKIINEAKRKNTLVIIDEAYIDFSKQKTFSRFVKKFNNLIVLKTFSKSYGLAGLRIAYLLSGKNFINTLNKIRSPFDLSHFSIVVAEYFLKNQNIKNFYVEQIRNSKKYLIQECMKRKIDYVDTETNFFHIKILNRDIKALYKYMLSKKFLIRTNFLNNFKKLNNSIRITVGDQATMKKFFINLDKFYETKG